MHVKPSKRHATKASKGSAPGSHGKSKPRPDSGYIESSGAEGDPNYAAVAEDDASSYSYEPEPPPRTSGPGRSSKIAETKHRERDNLKPSRRAHAKEKKTPRGKGYSRAPRLSTEQ